MHSVSCFFLIALLANSAIAQKGAPIITHEKGIHSTPPHSISESDRTKQCPVGFEFFGKQCAKTLTAVPEISCPPGTSITDNKCAKYVGKLSECPIGYTASKGTCVRTLFSDPELVCPNGYTLSGKDSCSIKIALPSRRTCPTGSLAKGDNCVTTAIEAPEYTCPHGYTQDGARCQREETFDCTPTRILPTQTKQTPELKPLPAWETVRREAPGKGKGASNIYTLHEAPSTVEEYVVQKTCKRIVTEAARKICPKHGVSDGKVCRVEIPVEHIVKKGGYKDEFVPAIRQCQQGYTPDTRSKGRCSTTEEVLPNIYCPANTIDLGTRCGTFFPTRAVCPHGFSHEGKECVKTIFAAPIVEYTVTYTCTGKDCGH